MTRQKRAFIAVLFFLNLALISLRPKYRHEIHHHSKSGTVPYRTVNNHGYLLPHLGLFAPLGQPRSLHSPVFVLRLKETEVPLSEVGFQLDVLSIAAVILCNDALFTASVSVVSIAASDQNHPTDFTNRTLGVAPIAEFVTGNPTAVLQVVMITWPDDQRSK